MFSEADLKSGFLGGDTDNNAGDEYDDDDELSEVGMASDEEDEDEVDKDDEREGEESSWRWERGEREWRKPLILMALRRPLKKEEARSGLEMTEILVGRWNRNSILCTNNVKNTNTHPFVCNLFWRRGITLSGGMSSSVPREAISSSNDEVPASIQHATKADEDDRFAREERAASHRSMAERRELQVSTSLITKLLECSLDWDSVQTVC